MGARYVCSDENKKILYVYANNLHAWARKENLPYVEIRFDEKSNLEDISSPHDDSELDYFLDCDLKYLDEKKQRNKEIPLLS